MFLFLRGASVQLRCCDTDHVAFNCQSAQLFSDELVLDEQIAGIDLLVVGIQQIQVITHYHVTALLCFNLIVLEIGLDVVDCAALW